MRNVDGVPAVDGPAMGEAVSSGPFEVRFGASVTDAGLFVDRMMVDFGEGCVSGVGTDSFVVRMTCCVDTGTDAGKAYAYFDASVPLQAVGCEVEGGQVTLYFRQDQAPALTWLVEGRNYPAELGFSVEQVGELWLRREDGRIARIEGKYVCGARSWADLVCPELDAFEDVRNEVNYRLHRGSNGKLIVWFHGNGEGDLPVGATGNNVVQLLGNRGGVAWTSAEAHAVFGDASVMAFQAPNMWYFAIADHLLEACYREIREVMRTCDISPREVYLAGCSAGGFMCTRMIIAYPDLFASAMICCPALDAANVRSGTSDACPTDDELQRLKDARTAIWLVQGDTDSVVDPDLCAKRIWGILSGGARVSEQGFEGEHGIASGFTTYEMADDRYKLTLYETFDHAEVVGLSGKKHPGGKLHFAEDYDLDGRYEEVSYSDHWSWIYTLRNNPQAADGTHIWEWATRVV